LLATFVGLLYAYTNLMVMPKASSSGNVLVRKQIAAYATTFVLSLVAYFAVSEVVASFYKMPFEYAGHCYQGAKETKKCDARK